MNPAVAKRAARLVVARRRDGSYDVAGDHGNYIVRIVDREAICTCLGGLYGNTCAHKIAALNKHESEKP